MRTHTAQESLHDFRNAHDPVMTRHHQMALGEYQGVQLGWDALDELTGGVFGGDLVSFVGRPAQGKTFKMLYAADTARRAGKVALFLTMEMKNIDIQQRLAAMVAGVPGMHLKKGQLMADKREQLRFSLQELAGTETPLFILDGGLKMRVDRLHLICQQIQPDIVFVDGAYMLKHPDASLQKFRRIDAVCEDLKEAIAMDLDLPVVASWQFNREKIKKAKKGEEVELTMDDIYGSDTIAHASSIILALTQSDSAATIKKRRLDGLKIRDAPRMSFYVNWDFYNMDFSQCEAPPQPGKDQEQQEEEAPYVT